MSEKVFIGGLIVKAPHANAPDYVKAKIAINMRNLIEFAKEHHNDGWLNADIKVSQGGKYYAELDTWRPDGQSERKPKQPKSTPQADFDDDPIPF